MSFFTSAKERRPIRLDKRIRDWARLSMSGKYGDEAGKTPFVAISCADFYSLPMLDKHDICLHEIVKNAPIRICEQELVSGSATLGEAINHTLPAFYNGEKVFSGVSHLTINFKTTLEKGIDYYENEINARLKDENLSADQVRFLQSLLSTIDALRIYHRRYLEATKTIKPEIYQNLLQVPFSPARNFYEAVQSVWFVFSFVRLCGNWPGIGRIDWLLGDYLKSDLESGVITLKRAREILASFFIKGTEWIRSNPTPSSGDAQHYQNIVLAGIDEFGKEVTNEVTYLVLDIVEELGISDFPITVRVNEKTSEKLLNKVAKVIRHGGGVVAVYNEPLIIKSMTDYGYDEREARHFANDGCWEVQVPGATHFRYVSFDALSLLQKVANDYENANFDTFEELYKAYMVRLKEYLTEIKTNFCLTENNIDNWGEEWTIYSRLPVSVVSLFTDGCIEKAKSYNENGAKYTVCSPHIGGTADVVNSFYAIKKLVFDEKIITLKELFTALKSDWKGYERIQAKTKGYSFYGTDNDEVDEIYKTLMHDFFLACKELDDMEEIKFPAGASTFGREIDWREGRLATASGKTSGVILAGNSSPTPGTDTEGATAVIKSYCKANLAEMVTGCALDIKISPDMLSGERGIVVIKSLIRGFVSLGGYFMQIDTVSSDTLKKAQENPSEYKTLSVRVSGWNARFITLTREWQDMIINRTAYKK